MEIIIALVFLGVGLWWFFLRDDKKPEVSAPYKVETPVVAEPVKVEATTPVVEAKPAKTTKPKAPAKTAKPKAPAKTPAKPKAPAKAPAKPKIKVAK